MIYRAVFKEKIERSLSNLKGIIAISSGHLRFPIPVMIRDQPAGVRLVGRPEEARICAVVDYLPIPVIPGSILGERAKAEKKEAGQDGEGA